MTTTTRVRPFLRLLSVPLAPAIWLERARGRRRLALLALYLLIAGALGLWGWRTFCLVGLPDVGEPFDASAFREANEVSEPKNAFALYHRAAAAYRGSALLTAPDPRSIIIAPRAGWALAAPAVHRWVEDNRPALAFWRLGTERPDGKALPPAMLGDPPRTVDTLDGFRWFAQMALLEGSRLEEAGDPSGAWAWYRAAYRSGRHAMMRDGLMGILRGGQIINEVDAVVRRWVAEPRVDTPLLRRALADVQDAAALAPATAADVLRSEYPEFMATLERYLKEARDLKPSDRPDWYDHLWIPGIGELGRLPDWARFAIGREEDRGRRVARLAFANWIAAAESGRLDQPAVARAVGDPSSSIPDLEFFEVGPGDPPSARALTPEALADWAATLGPSRELLANFWDNFRSAIIRGAGSRDRLAATLIQALQDRAPGAPPGGSDPR